MNFTRISRREKKKELHLCNSLIFSVAGGGPRSHDLRIINTMAENIKTLQINIARNGCIYL